MLHSFTNKGSRRWRYYVCRKAQQHGWTTCPAPSLQAPEIERFVAKQIKQIAASPELLEATLDKVRQQMEADPGGGASLDVTQAEVSLALSEFNRLWDSLLSGEKNRVLSLLVENVTYDGVAGQVSITFRPAGLQTLGGQCVREEEVAA
jgi:hypothetical protein